MELDDLIITYIVVEHKTTPVKITELGQDHAESVFSEMKRKKNSMYLEECVKEGQS